MVFSFRFCFCFLIPPSPPKPLPPASPLQVSYLGPLKDIKQNPMYEQMSSRVPRNHDAELPVQPLLRPRSMTIAEVYVRRALPSALHPPPPPPPPPVPSPPRAGQHVRKFKRQQCERACFCVCSCSDHQSRSATQAQAPPHRLCSFVVHLSSHTRTRSYSPSEIQATLATEPGEEAMLPVGEALFGSMADTGTRCKAELRAAAAAAAA